jgi:hypothetical protein
MKEPYQSPTLRTIADADKSVRDVFEGSEE